MGNTATASVLKKELSAARSQFLSERELYVESCRIHTAFLVTSPRVAMEVALEVMPEAAETMQIVQAHAVENARHSKICKRFHAAKTEYSAACMNAGVHVEKGTLAGNTVVRSIRAEAKAAAFTEDPRNLEVLAEVQKGLALREEEKAQKLSSHSEDTKLFDLGDAVK